MEAHPLLVLLATLMVVAPSRQQLSPCPTLEGDHEDGSSCFTFLRCQNGAATRFQCPQTRPFFDPALRRCSPRQRPGCVRSSPVYPPVVATNGGGRASINQIQIAGVPQPQPLRQLNIQPNLEALLGGTDIPIPVDDSLPLAPLGGADPSFGAGVGVDLPGPVLGNTDFAARGGSVPTALDGATSRAAEAASGSPAAGVGGDNAPRPVGVVLPVGVAVPPSNPPLSSPRPVVGGAVEASAGSGTDRNSRPSAGAFAGVQEAGSTSLRGGGGNTEQNNQAWRLAVPATPIAAPGALASDAKGQPVLLLSGAGLPTPGGSSNTEGLQLGSRQGPGQPTDAGWTAQRSQGQQGSGDPSARQDPADLQPSGQLSRAVARASANTGQDGSVSASAAAVASGNSQGQSQAEGRVQGVVQPGGTITAVFPVLVSTQQQNANLG